MNRAAGSAGGPLKCLCCRMTDPPPEETCHLGRDHRVGHAAGCPGCGRLIEACARRPCSAVRLAAFRAGLPAGLIAGPGQPDVRVVLTWPR